MPINPSLAAFLPRAAKAAGRHPPMRPSCRLPINTPARISNVSKTAAAPIRQHSTWPGKNNNGQDKKDTLSTLSTLSTLLAAGTGTFASTLLALYLATVVETSAHEFLYEYFPHWYSEVAEEDLPNCLKSREVARRETGLVELNRARGVEGMGSLMGLDGWMEPTTSSNEGEGRIVDAELLAELEFEKRQAERGISVGNEGDNEAHALSSWQRRITEKRAGIIEREERDFSRGFASSSPDGSSHGKNKGGSLEAEARRLQEEAAKKLRERLMSVAMTA